MQVRGQYTFADFFAGIGLVRVGLERRGWSAAYAIDHDPKKRDMYAGHFPDAEYHYNLRDIHEVRVREIPRVTLAHASFPCTDLSLAGARNGLNGRGSSAFWGFIRVLEEMGPGKPLLVTLENVPGFITSHRGRDLETALNALNDLGYAVDLLLIDAAHFVPQSRQRLFIVGSLGHVFPDSPFRSERALACRHPARTGHVESFIRDNPHLNWRLRDLPILPRRSLDLAAVVEESPDIAWWERERVDYLMNQMFDRHLRVVHHMMEGEAWSYGTIFRRMRHRGGEKLSTAELRVDGVAGCLRTPKGGSAKQILFRGGYGRADARLLSGRECARLMGAGDFMIRDDLHPNDVLFGFGDAVCAPVISWLSEHYLEPLLAEASAAAVFDNPRTNPMSESFRKQLELFERTRGVKGKGPLAVVLHVTRVAKEKGLPLKPESLITPGKGQVEGLGRASVQAVLEDYGIERVLAAEGGRTSRGSLGLMQAYVALLNDMHQQGKASVEEVERWWIARVREHFAASPFRLRYDSGKSLRVMVTDLLDQARRRQEESPGATIVGTVMQHLVGAKLELAIPENTLHHYGAAVADAPTGRGGDFVINDVAIHVTTFPGPPLIEKCRQNLEAGLRPILVTLRERISLAEGLSEAAGIQDRIELFDVEQFVTANLHELSDFSTQKHRPTLSHLLEVYNRIVESCESDPGLRITLS